MASNMYALKCPCCGRSAIEDYYYKTDEKYTFCLRCGYYYTKTIESYKANDVEYKEEKNDGHGVFILTDKNGSRKKMMLNGRLSDAQIEEYKASFMDGIVDQKKSYLVSYENGVFKILLGNPPENFYLSFDEYREKMFSKYGVPEYDFMVPIEE
ncbi:hypothetical protein [Neobacillus cucumis]|uniref:hypothetical protein n=1 Tax=Neobacillus cucumis TaxID=1740721 RepID=UPI0019668EEA|nr:hypothetical protein [Neobacillus cucumis]MBM7650922.1 hypothetical protein [Neobacillus cucumis]